MLNLANPRVERVGLQRMKVANARVEGVGMQRTTAATLGFANPSTCVLNLANVRVKGAGLQRITAVNLKSAKLSVSRSSCQTRKKTWTGQVANGPVVQSF